MKRGLIAGLLLISVLFVSAAILKAEVKKEEKSQFKMEGIMGRMMGMFGGKAAKEGAISTIAVKGNRKITTGENASEIIDLGEQKIYNLDLKKKNYEVITFEEMRRRLRESQEKASKAVKDEGSDAKQAPEKQMEVDFSLKESGQKRTINGYDCREVVATITAREKGKTLEEAGGMVMTSHMWLGPSIPAIKEIDDFDQRYAKAMELTLGLGGSAEQMAMATAMYPGMKNMIGKMQVESVNMQGTSILTEMTMESVKSQAQLSQEAQQKPTQESDSSSISSVRGIGGMLGRRLAKKKESEGAADKPKDRVALITTSQELLKVDTSVPDSDLAIPAGFKEKK
jgi:hypothetical protein